MKAIETGLHVEIGTSNGLGQYFTRILSIATGFGRSPGGAAYHHKWYCPIIWLPKSYLGSHHECCSSDELCPSRIRH